MKVGISLDGLLCDTESLKQEWRRVEGDYNFLSDTAFWAALKPYDDVVHLGDIVSALDIYVFAERPKAVFMPTRAWLRNNAGLKLNKDRIIMQALKRFDCRTLGIQHFIDSDLSAIENLKTETVRPIKAYLVDRKRGDSLRDVVEEIKCEYSPLT